MSDKPVTIRELVKRFVADSGLEENENRDELITALEEREYELYDGWTGAEMNDYNTVSKLIEMEEQRDRLALVLSEANRSLGELRHAAKLALEELDTEYVGGREDTQEIAQFALRNALEGSESKEDRARREELVARLGCGTPKGGE